MSKLTTVLSFVQTRWVRNFRTRQQLEHYQQRQLQRHLSFVKQASPYFKKRTSLDSKNLSSWPTMDKAIMMKHFNTMNTLGLNKAIAMRRAVQSEKSRDFSQQYAHISVGLSSGTSGHRGMFIVEDTEREAWAGTILAKILPKLKFIKHRVAFFLRADNSLYQTVASAALQFEYFDIYKNMDEHIARLREYQPTLLVAPPSVLLIIAKAIEQGQLTLHPQKVISVAEVLTASDEQYLQKVLKQDVIHQVYQCTEGFLAFTCNQGTLHLNEDLAVFEKEYIDDVRFIPIITDFHRKSQPIIRYRLNDVLVEKSSPCTCGSVLQALERIEGREGDILLFKNSKENVVKVFSDMIARCMIYASGFHEYRVVQTSYDCLEIYVDEQSSQTQKNITREFAHLAKQLNFSVPTIAFKPYEHDVSKKLRRIERSF